MDASTIGKRLKERLYAQNPLKPAEMFLQLGRSDREGGAFDASERVLSEGLRAYPGHLGLMTELAELAMARKDWAGANVRWQEVLDNFDEKLPAPSYARAAFAFRMDGELTKADEVAGRGLKLYEGNAPLHRELARSAMAREDWSAAVSNWDKFLAENTRNSSSEAYAGLVRSRRNASDLDGAEALLQEALLKFPRDVRLLAEQAVFENYRRPVGALHEKWSVSDQISVEIIVCVYNALEATSACLEALRTWTNDDQLITVVDDASEPSVRAFLERFVAKGKSWRLLTNDNNQGYTKSANRGLRAARSDWVILLNSDTLVSDGWLHGLRRCALSDSRVRAVGPLSNLATFQSIPSSLDELQDRRSRLEAIDCVAKQIREASHTAFPKVPMLNGFCLMLHRPTLEDVGYLDEDNFPRGYGEENDLCLRLLVRGHKLAIADNAFVYHSRSESFGVVQRQELTEIAVKTLKRLWPGYSYKHISDLIEELPALRQLKAEINQRKNERYR